MKDNIWAEKGKSGFTLIEMLVTFIIIAALVSIGVPAFSNWLPGYRLRSATMDLYANLQLAKMSAIRNNIEYAVAFNTGADAYQIVSGGADGVYSTAGDNVTEVIISLSDYESGVDYGNGNATTNATSGGGGTFPSDGVSYTSNRVVFNSKGIGNAGYVYLDNDRDDTYAIGSLMTGVIRLRKWNGTAWE